MHHTDQLTDLRTRKLLLLLELSFLKECRTENVFPNFIQKNCPNNFNGFYMKKRHLSTKKSLLRAAIKDTRSRLARTELQLYRLHSDLMFFYNPIIWTILDTISWGQAHAKEQGKKTILQKKMYNLIKNQKPRPPTFKPSPPPSPTVNLSKFNLTPEQNTVLDYGLNFAHNVPKSIFLHDIICSTDYGISRSLTPDVAIVAKHDIKNIINDFIPPKQFDSYNLTKKLTKQDIYVLRSDKGNNTVLLDKPNYEQHMADLLNDSSTYSKLNKDPTNSFFNSVKSIIKSCTSFSETILKSLIPSAHNLANFYGLPKIHKPSLAFRPIVSKVNSITYSCAKFISSKIKFLNSLNKFTVQNSTDFVKKLKNVTLEENDILISLDVTSLYTSVPTDDAISCLESKLNTLSSYLPGYINDLIKLTSMCVENTFFKFRDYYFKQASGLAMGCPLSSTLANIFMDDIDIKINSLPFSPSFYVRYVDDIFIIWKHNLANFKLFVETINQIHPAIKFTTEIETNQSLPFLDVLVKKDATNKSFITSVYRKPNSNNASPHAKSAHPMHQKMSAFKGFVNRAHNLCSNPETLHTELNFLRNLATNRGYNRNIIDNFYRKLKNKLNINSTTSLQSQKQPHIGFAVIPYIPGLSGKIGSALKNYNIKSIYKPFKKSSDILNSHKNKPLNSELSGIYSIPCLECPKKYIGQTKRNFKTRLDEHYRASGFNKKQNRYDQTKIKPQISAVAGHHNDTNHKIDWTNAAIIKPCPIHLLNINEQLLIHKFPNHMNKKEDNRFPLPWKTLIDQV